MDTAPATCERYQRGVLTFEEPRRAVNAFRAQLVVAKAAQELGDENVGQLGHGEGAHVAEENVDGVAPLERLALLQRRECASVLLHGVDVRVTLRALQRPQRRCDKRAAAGTSHDDDQRLAARRLPLVVHHALEHSLLVLAVLDGVGLEHVICRAAEVVGERLQRGLEVVPVPPGQL